MKHRWLGPAFLALLLACSAEPAPQASIADGAGAGEAGVAVALDAVDFTLADVNGTPVNLSDHRGKIVIVDFWATWCPPCLFQVPELNKLRAAHIETDDIAVIGVSVDVEGAEVVGPWIEEQGVEYTILLGDEQLARERAARPTAHGKIGRRFSEPAFSVIRIHRNAHRIADFYILENQVIHHKLFTQAQVFGQAVVTHVIRAMA